MSDKPTLTPAEALDRLFEVIRDEALSNPNFARRMLTAVGCQVVFAGNDAASSADPILVAAGGDFTAFHETFMSFSEKELKTFITNFGLATAEDVKTIKGKNKKPGFVQLMWDGARRKLAERRPH